MEFFLPSLLIVIFAVAVIFSLFPKMGPFMLAILAAVALFFATRNHLSVFKQDYATMTWTTSAKAAAPYILVGVVILFSIGYLLFLWGAGKSVNLPMPPASIPPPNSATNIITSAIGNGLKATGLATVSATANANAAPPANKNVNMSKNQLTTAEKESIASKIA
jgi:hypothetical protein